MIRKPLLLTALFASCSFALAGVAQADDWADPQRANQCYLESSQRSGIPYRLLLAVKMTESGTEFNPYIHRRNRNGSFDIGPMQVNTIWLPQLAAYGIDAQRLFDPCVNVEVASKILAYTIAKEGDWVRGLARYHTGSSRPWSQVAASGMAYAKQVMAHYQSLGRYER